MTNTLKDYYKRLRANGATATRAITLARDNLAINRPLYDIPCKRAIEYNRQSASGGRWIENVTSGLRFKGYSDEVATRLRHKGWFTDNDGMGEVLRGAVWQLPARDGQAQYVYGYADPCNHNCAYIVFNPVTCEIDAAYAGDRMAELAAEKEREYQESWQAGKSFACAGDDLKTVRADTIALISAIRKERQRGAPSVICDALRSKVREYVREAQKLRERRAALLDDYSAAWRKDLRAAFNDGAGETVLEGV